MELDWGYVVIRALPLLTMIVLRYRLNESLDMDGATGEQRLRRTLMVDLVLGSTFVIFAGALARVGLVSSDLAGILYTAYGAVVFVIAAALLWRFRERRR